MNRTQRIWIGAILALLALSALMTGTVIASELDLLPARPVSPAQPARAAQATPGDRPFMGLADPAAPYDQRFLDEMIMHHQCAIMSAQGMIANSSRPELRNLARRIVDGQQRQIDQLRAWRQQWYPNAPAPAMDMEGMMGGGMMGGMMGGGMMGGMMGGGMMGGMMGGNRGGMMGGGMGGMMDGGAGSAEADRAFLRMMIPHHQLAIDMAQDALTNAEHAELEGLAREIIADQSSEITEMEGFLKAWYGEDSTRNTAAAMRDTMRQMMEMMRRMGGACH